MSGFVQVVGLTEAGECLHQLGELQATAASTLSGGFITSSASLALWDFSEVGVAALPLYVPCFPPPLVSSECSIGPSYS